MLLLKILTLLEDERVKNVSALSKIVASSRNEQEFDEAIKPLLKSSIEDFNDKWADHGFASSVTEVWTVLLKNHYLSVALNSLQNQTKVKLPDLENNVEATDTILEEVATYLAESHLMYGSDINKTINSEVRRAFQNNKAKYRKMYNIDTSGVDVNPVVLQNQGVTRHMTNGLESLRNVPSAEVRALLYDLYETHHLYKLYSEQKGLVTYSMYESFLMVHFKRELVEFNAKHKGYINIDTESRVDRKFLKFDIMLEDIYDHFIIRGISEDNFQELLHAVFDSAQQRYNNNIAALFGVSNMEGNLKGNFSHGKTFATSGISVEKFDRYIKGIVALSKVYRYLTDAGLTPYHIHADIFNPAFGDPSDKFLTLAEVVEYSADVVHARDKYDLREQLFQLKAVNERETGGMLFPRNTEDIILSQRNKITVEDLTASVVSLTARTTARSYSTLYIEDINLCVNLFDLVSALSHGTNPLYQLFEGDSYEWDDSDEDELIDLIVLDKFFTRVLGKPAINFIDRAMNRRSLEMLMEYVQGDLKDLLEDLQANDLDSTLKILTAIEDFVEDFKEVGLSFKEKYRGCKITSVEYSSFIYSHPMFKGLHSLIDPIVPRLREDKLMTDVTLTLIKPYYPELTEEELIRFLDQNVKNISYDNFLSSIRNRAFKDVMTAFNSAKANLYNISKFGVPVKLPQHMLDAVMRNLPHIANQDEFINIHRGVKQDEDGYLIDELGGLYCVKIHNNKIGALHSQGVIIFNDGTTKPWDWRD